MTDSQCQFTGCTRPPKTPSGRWCSTHASNSRRQPRQRNRRASGSAALRDEHGRKLCPTCDRWMDVSNFYPQDAASDGLKTPCKRCHIARRFGINGAQYDAMLNAQNGRCAICKREAANLAVDHDHDTGKVRALLCRACNTGLGFFGDDVEMLTAAIAYLNDHSSPDLPR